MFDSRIAWLKLPLSPLPYPLFFLPFSLLLIQSEDSLSCDYRLKGTRLPFQNFGFCTSVQCEAAERKIKCRSRYRAE